MSLSVHDLNSRARNFQENAKQRFEADRRKAEKERIVKERARGRREAHDAAVAELRRRQEEEAEKVIIYENACVGCGQAKRLPSYRCSLQQKPVAYRRSFSDKLTLSTTGESV